KEINKAFENQYGRDAVIEFSQMDLDKVILIIDDFDKSRLKTKFRARVLENVKSYYPNFILSSSDFTQLEELISDEAIAGDLYASIVQYEIQDFGYRLQNKLINKWNSLGIEQFSSDEKRIKQNENSLQIIKTVIGKNFVPIYP